MLDAKALRTLSYGLYIVSTKGAKGNAGCVVNTFSQVTSKPEQCSVAINKGNATCGAVLEAGRFAVSVLDETAPLELIGTFGFHSSADTDKFAQAQTCFDAADMPYVAEHACARFSVKVQHTLDLGSHMLFIGLVEQAETLSPQPPMTYAYYHQVKGGKTPPKASSYIAEEPAPAPADAAPKVGWKCMLCGHIEYVDELPDDFTCPICGAGKEMFERIEL
ncbi:flavin reductase [Denitrobacterium detoxificans]|uniref:flavin reductase n=1 Tax=Denitrobacterium detoxificans TaxID=79604 RepID=UPI0026EC82DC|nr:flavin reductase [Denitrobacterium detoxificans]MBE6465922.1 flavin reductase [Denitrobacterium detoxificans]